ncbi:MAG: hypothetical protein NTY19_35710 [Planctomycetota bacterium]|nr:hypothetical protein [Planctomycetota bacterium]
MHLSAPGHALKQPSPSGLAYAALAELDDVLSDIASDVACGWDRGYERHVDRG